MRCAVEEFGIGLCLARYLLHGFNEGVERLLGLGFGRLYHQRFVEEQREINGRGVVAIIQQTLGHIERGDMSGVVVVAALFGAQTIEDELVLAESFNGQLIEILQAFLDIVGVEH